MNHWDKKGKNHEYRKANDSASTPELGLSLSSSNIFLAIVSRVSSPRTSQQTQTRLGLSLSSSNFSSPRTSLTGTDPACVISTDCARAFTLFHRLNLRYGLCCFGFHGYTVVYPVPNKYAFTRKLIIRTFGLYLQV